MKSKPSCHTLLKALDISKKTPLTSNLSSNDLDISWVIACNWLTQESPGLQMQIYNSNAEGRLWDVSPKFMGHEINSIVFTSGWYAETILFKCYSNKFHRVC